MSTNFGHTKGPSQSYCYRQDLDRENSGGLSLSRRAELASDAFVAGGIVRLMNDIVNKHEIPKATGTSLLDDGIWLVEQLERGDTYLSERRAHLIPQPESADTVRYIRARGTSNIEEHTKEALSILTHIKNILIEGSMTALANLDAEGLESARVFFRTVHTSIMDQLGASELPTQRVNRD
jgi:hypothetical protein